MEGLSGHRFRFEKLPSTKLGGDSKTEAKQWAETL
jgi:hypothetical protein